MKKKKKEKTVSKVKSKRKDGVPLGTGPGVFACERSSLQVLYTIFNYNQPRQAYSAMRRLRQKLMAHNCRIATKLRDRFSPENLHEFLRIYLPLVGIESVEMTADIKLDEAGMFFKLTSGQWTEWMDELSIVEPWAKELVEAALCAPPLRCELHLNRVSVRIVSPDGIGALING